MITGLIQRYIKPVMLLVGVVTCSMLLNFFNPQLGLNTTFGATIDGGPIADIVVRNWGALIALTGGMLIYAAFKPHLRAFAIGVSCISKLTFIGLVLMFGQQFMSKAVVAIVFDGIVVLVFLIYLLGERQTNSV